MSLIKCPECGKEISDKASACPNCGCPASEWKEKANEIEEDEAGEKAKKNEEELEKFFCNECRTQNEIGADYCIFCGNRLISLSELKTNVLNEKRKEPKSPYTICPECGEYNPTGVFRCKNCGHKYLANEYKVIISREKSDKMEERINNIPFNGVYRYTLFGGKQEVRCPRCGSENCSHHQEQKIIPGKTKASYSANLNPLKPFTFANKKEKVKRKEQVITESKFICNSCGYIFK